MAQSAEDVARESIECYKRGGLRPPSPLLADDFYEEELATQRRLGGGGCPGRGGAGLEAIVPGRARHGHRHMQEREHRGDRAHLGGHAQRSDRDARRPGAAPSNKRISVKSVEVIEVEDGKLTTLRHYFDLMTLLKQIGAMNHADAAIASRLHRAEAG